MKKSRILVVALLALCLAFSALTLTGCGEKLSDTVFVFYRYENEEENSIMYHGEETLAMHISQWSSDFKPIGYKGKDPGVVKFKAEIPADAVKFAGGVFENKRVVAVERVDDTHINVKIAGSVSPEKDNGESSSHAIRIYASAFENTIEKEYVQVSLRYQAEAPKIEAKYWTYNNNEMKILLSVPAFGTNGANNVVTSVKKEDVKYYTTRDADISDVDDITDVSKLKDATDAENYSIKLVNKTKSAKSVYNLEITFNNYHMFFEERFDKLFVSVNVNIGDGCEGDADSYLMLVKAEKSNAEYPADVNA